MSFPSPITKTDCPEGNSAVCYSLGITSVDPIAMELYFERFLSEERGEWPDMDLDLPSVERRERVIQHVYKWYRERGAVMTANVITYRGRSAAREVGKVMGFETETLSRVSSLMPGWGWQDPDETADKRSLSSARHSCSLLHEARRALYL